MASPVWIRGMFPVPKPCPKPALGSWIGFQVEQGAVIDLEAARVSGFQGLIRSVPPDPSQGSDQDTSEVFTVTLTTEPDAYNPHPGGDVGAIRALVDARIAALAVIPRRTFAMTLGNEEGIGVTTDPFRFEPTDNDVQQLMGIVLLRAKLHDTMGVYDDPAWNGAPIMMTVNGVPV